MKFTKEELENEVWKDIPNYEGLYQASSLGRIRSLDKTKWNGSGWYILKGRIMKPYTQNAGYLGIHLSKDGKMTSYVVHRLIALTFLGESELTVNHKNENKHDNRVSNLEYMTRYENMMYGTGRKRSYKARSIPVESYDLITGETIKEYSVMNGVTEDGYRQGCVCNCCIGRTKSHAGLGWRYKQN